MSEQILQQNRLLQIASPLGTDVLILRRLTVHEAVSDCFRIEAEVLSSNAGLKATDLIGGSVTCTVKGDAERHFNGIVHRFGRVGTSERNITTYRLEARPKLFDLSRRRNSRIFVNLKPEDVIRQVLNAAGVSPVRFGPSTTTSMPREYTTQYDETDLEFVSRLLTELGWSYWHEHASGSHTLVITGDNVGFGRLANLRLGQPEDAGTRTIWDWTRSASLPTGSVSTMDFDAPKPDPRQVRTSNSILFGSLASGARTFLHPSGRAIWSGSGDPQMALERDPAKIVMEAAEAGSELLEAVGTDPDVHAGARVAVTAEGGVGGNFLIIEVVHQAVDDTHFVGGGEATYGNRLALVPSDRPYRTAAVARRPTIPGLLWAVVTSGADTQVDQYGRVKIHFPWDNAGEGAAERWCNVLQGVAGAWGGMQFIPRVGDWVAVAFLNGDPEHPVIVGSVYTDRNPAPFALTANRTQSGIKTHSIPDGGENILRFEDKQGSEMVHLQAEKDLDVLVKNDTTIYTKHDHTEKVKNNRTTTIEEGNEKLTVAKGNMNTEVSMGNQDNRVKMGNITEKVDLGSNTSEAMQSITLKVGQNSIVIDQTGITLKGIMIKIEGTAMLETKAPMAQHNGDGMMIIKGGIVMIN